MHGGKRDTLSPLEAEYFRFPHSLDVSFFFLTSRPAIRYRSSLCVSTTTPARGRILTWHGMVDWYLSNQGIAAHYSQPRLQKRLMHEMYSPPFFPPRPRPDLPQSRATKLAIQHSLYLSTCSRRCPAHRTPMPHRQPTSPHFTAPLPLSLV